MPPGIPGVSGNVRLFIICWRFMEYSCIYHLHHNGASRVFLSSADKMTRKMVELPELLFPNT
ncbi:hypothetical protein [Halobacillus litoralis]|uniref:hypothetical protein n=1 Tax=Halobacillus litoralis TaxID=45668 RepID=UPI003D7E2B0E